MKVIVTQDILPRIRHLAREALVGAKSAHVAEALAAGLGHASNAALLAWLEKVPLSGIPAASFSPSRAADRLRILDGTHAEAEEAFAGAVASAGVLIKGADLAEEAASAEGKFAAGGWGALGNRQRFARAALLLHAAVTAGKETEFMEQNADAGSVGLHMRLAACVQSKRDLDRLVADFLAEFLVAAEAEAWTGRLKEALAWGACVYRAYGPRVRAFLDMACMTWPDEDDPLAASPAPQALKRLGRPPVVVEGKSSCSHEFGIGDTGQEAPGIDVLMGVCCMAMLKAGEPKREISSFAAARLEGRRAVEACLARVASGDGGGVEEAVSRLVSLLVPERQAASAEGIR